jgi:hypothetical protein
MTDHEEQVPPPVELLGEGAAQAELPQVGDVLPAEPLPDDPEAPPSAAQRPGLPPLPAER